MTGLRQACARVFGGLHGPLVAATLVAFLLRALRLEWQPLWWDEGYSVFFATEPLAKMLALTAQDIHPPLYYALLHLWTLLLGSARPGVIRLLSVYAGVTAVPLLGVLAYVLTRRRGVALLAACLLALNPLHVYYSQEVRMYSLALLLGLASTYALVKLAAALDVGSPTRGEWIAWIVLNALLLYTLYYAAFLVVAQFIWLAIGLRRRPRALLTLVAAATATALLCLPWWLFALPKLAAYIGDKVQSDQDTPLGPLTFGARHLLAFSMGHVQLAGLALPARAFAYMGVIAAIPALLTLRKAARRHPRGASALNGAPGLLWTLFLVPSLLAFVLNLSFPFFPEGGERLLLFVLPYYLLLISLGLFTLQLRSLWRPALLTPLLVAGAVGLSAFFTVPRYVEDDYRPIIAQVMQQGSDDDSVLALFPWQVGYWRAYSPMQTDGRLLSPQPAPVGQGALLWSSPMQDAIDEALRRGVLWFPEPVSLGSTLPDRIEAYLQDTALNVENRWHGAATRLTAWTALPPDAPWVTVAADFGPLTLDAATVTPHAASSANTVLAVALQWSFDADPAGIHVTLRLRDDAGRDWAGRDYAPPGRFAAEAAPAVEPGGTIITDTLGLLVPPGLPPGEYTLFAAATEATGDTLPLTPAEMHALAQIAVANPPVPLSPHRLLVDYPARGPKQSSAVVILGATGLPAGLEQLAGAELAFSLALRKTTAEPADFDLSVRLLDRRGAEVAGWEGWPLPAYPTSAWPVQGLTLVPVSFFVPPSTPAGPYTLAANLVSRADLSRSPAQHLADIDVRVRPALMTRPQPQVLLPSPVQFGTHVRLYGYDYEADGDAIQLALYWEVLQTLLPPHSIFVHMAAPSGDIIAQQDGPPVTAGGPAPTGSWRPGEFIVSRHTINLPATFAAGGTPPQWRLRTGLYEPTSEVRLPASVDGLPAGDSVEIAGAP